MTMAILLKAKLIAFILTLGFGIGWFIYKSLRPAASNLKPAYAGNPNPREPSVWFSSGGRSGEMGYASPEGSFKMYWEMGGGDVVAIIYLPKPEDWEAKTTIPLAKRETVLNFIGKKTVEQQTTGGKGSYVIDNNCILIKS